MYTYENWINFKTRTGLTNRLIADAIGTTEDNVKKQLGPTKKLPTWIRSMLLAASLIESIPSIITLNATDEQVKDINDHLNKDKTNPWDRVGMLHDAFVQSLIDNPPMVLCDCYLDNGLLKRGKITCTLKKAEHPWLMK